MSEYFFSHDIGGATQRSQEQLFFLKHRWQTELIPVGACKIAGVVFYVLK